jgi:hypothetical protein
MSLAETDKYANAKESAQCSYDCIVEMVDALDTEDDNARDDAAQRIHEDALSVEVNYGWVYAGQLPEHGPDEYAILIATGGPAIRVRGDLNEYSEPETAYLEVQDWFVPWQRFDPPNYDQDVLLTYAQQFYFVG